jgi:hypothetical protein
VSDTIRDLLETNQIILVPEYNLMKTLRRHYFDASGEPRHDTSSQPRHIVDVCHVLETRRPSLTLLLS